MKSSVNSLVPNEDAKMALLWELYKCGGEGDTGYIVERAMAHFPVLQTLSELNRETPSGRPWWKGRFRFDLSSLGVKGEAQNVKRGVWRITAKGRERLRRGGYNVAKDNEAIHVQKEDGMANEPNLPKKLIDLWMTHTEGSKAERCQQVCEGVLGLELLCELPEMKDISDKLHTMIDFNELYRMAGQLYVTAFRCRAPVIIKEGQTLTEKLMDLWTSNTDGSKAEMCQQVCERVFGLLSLAALPETKPIFDELWQKLDFDKLYWMAGSLGITGFWGKDTYLEPF